MDPVCSPARGAHWKAEFLRASLRPRRRPEQAQVLAVCEQEKQRRKDPDLEAHLPPTAAAVKMGSLDVKPDQVSPACEAGGGAQEGDTGSKVSPGKPGKRGVQNPSLSRTKGPQA